MCSLLYVCVCLFQADVGGSGAIGAMDAAAYLKKSGLPETLLAQVRNIYHQ